MTAIVNLVASPDAEVAVLGAALISDQAAALAVTALDRRDFDNDGRAAIFAALCKLTDQREPVDGTAIAQVLRDAGTYDRAGGMSALHNLLAGGLFISPAHTSHYIEILKGKTLRRHLADAGNRIYAIAKDESTTPTEALGAAEAALQQCGVGARLTGGIDIADAVRDQLDMIHTPESAVEKVQTGIYYLDEAIGGGLRGGWNVVVLAAPGHGKTAFALGNVVAPACQDGYWAVIGTQEMSPREVSGRMVASMSGVPPMEQMRGAERMDPARLQVVNDGASCVAGWNLRILSGCTVQQLRLEAERMQREHGGMGVVCLDYAQITPVSLGRRDATRTEEIEHVSKSMKAIARDLGCIALTLSQPTASAARSGNVRASDGKGAQALSADADLILIPKRTEGSQVAQITIDKNRSGPFPVCVSGLEFDAGRIRFKSGGM